MVWVACHCHNHTKPTWHFGRMSSLWSFAPPGPLENMDLACFPSAGPQTDPNKICCIVLPKDPSFHVTPTTTAATTAACPSGRPMVTVPEFTGAFPAVRAAISIQCPPPPHQQPLGALHFGICPEAFCFSLFYIIAGCHIILSEIIG